jgi:hypothetical protein
LLQLLRQQRHIFRITAHFLTTDCKRRKVNLDISPINVAPTGENIRIHFERILAEWPGVKEKLYAIVRDGASCNKVVGCKLSNANGIHMLQAFEDAGYLSPRCAAHLFALVVYDCIDSQAIVKNAIDIIRRTVRIFRKSNVPRVQLELVQRQANVNQPLVLMNVGGLSSTDVESCL